MARLSPKTPLLIVAALALSICAADGAYAQVQNLRDTGPVISLQQFHVVYRDGKASFEAVDKTSPGDVIEYRAYYENKGSKGVSNLDIDIPIPRYVEYVPKSARPAGAIFKAQGEKFSAEPLTEIGEGGKVTFIPYDEYRIARWSIASVAAGEKGMVRLRVKVSGLDSATPKVLPASPPTK